VRRTARHRVEPVAGCVPCRRAHARRKDCPLSIPDRSSSEQSVCGASGEPRVYSHIHMINRAKSKPTKPMSRLSDSTMVGRHGGDERPLVGRMHSRYGCAQSVSVRWSSKSSVLGVRWTADTVRRAGRNKGQYSNRGRQADTLLCVARSSTLSFDGSKLNRANGQQALECVGDGSCESLNHRLSLRCKSLSRASLH
jgi:hypothetical protein